MENLPTNLLIKIFDFLNHTEYIALSRVCKKFLEVTTNFMAIKFPPLRIDFQYLSYNNQQKFTYKGGKDFNVLIETPRHYQNYIFLNFNKEHTDRLNNKWLLLFKRQINTRTVRIKSDCLDLRQLSSMLKLMHRLIYLEIDGYRLAKIESINENDDVVDLPSLKHLKIHSFLDADTQLFKIFENCNALKTISMNAIYIVNRLIVNNFIYKQRALEQLELIGLDSHNELFQCDPDIKAQFQLKKIQIEYNGFSLNLSQLLNFFKDQKQLNEVKLKFDFRNSIQQVQDFDLFEEIIQHCMSLESLSSLNIIVNKYKRKEANSNRLSFKSNTSIRQLCFEDESRDNNKLLIALLKSLYKRLEYLEVACEYDDEMLMQFPHLVKLKHLKLTDYQQGLLKRIKGAENLESLTVKYCYTRNSGSDWLDFLNTHPKINEIQIKHSIDFIDDATIEVITGACGENLESFIMSDSVARNISEHAIKSFQKNCPNLKYLQLTDPKPSRNVQNKNQSFHDMLANIKCVITFYIVCIIFLVALVLLMVLEKI